MYNINYLTSLELALQSTIRGHFKEFFSTHDYKTAVRGVASQEVTDLAGAEALYYSTGLYLILTDYQKEQNSCSLVVDGLKAIYRGHCYTVKSRIKSHLFNDHYRSKLPERGVRYDVCMKLDGNNGININAKPYSDYRWRVIVHKMKGSSKMMREQAELAFDETFGRPLGSREAADSAKA